MPIFAQTGPMTHSTNAEKDPRKAITVENSGMRIETPTAIRAKATRSMISMTGWLVVRSDVANAVADLVVGDTGRDEEEGLAGLSIPNHNSIVRLSCQTINLCYLGAKYSPCLPV